MSGGLVAGVVGGGVVPRAEGEAVLDVCRAALEPGIFVVDVAPVGGDLAALGSAGLVAGEDQPPLGLGVKALLAPVARGWGVPAEHDRDDPGLAREAAALGR